jgi:hypothetical protein
LAVHRLPLQEAFAMALRGEIRDALSVASLLKLKCLIDAGNFDFSNKEGGLSSL